MKTYKLKATPQELISKWFKYSNYNQSYSYDFPVYKYKRKPLIICKMLIYEDEDNVNFTIVGTNGNLYAPYYNRDFGQNEIVDIIDKNIKKEFNKLGIKSKKVGDIQ